MMWPEFEGFWDPWRQFEDMRRTLGRATLPARVGFPAVNVWANEEGAVTTAEIPGVQKDSLDISVEGNALVLRGSRKPEQLHEEETYHRRERWQGGFSKVVSLPFNVQADKVQARYSKGVLYVALPRAEAEKPKKIAITSE
ncbi:MAG: Hsp20/alpha crystallin family protein [Nitrospirota bacterium]|jgi:HSP20 family protein